MPVFRQVESRACFPRRNFPPYLSCHHTHLGWSAASVSHLSLKFDLRHTLFIFTRQNITVVSSHMSESHAHHIFPGVMSHISIRSSFFFFFGNLVILFVVSQNTTPVNIPREISTLQNDLLKYHTCYIVRLTSHTWHVINIEISPPDVALANAPAAPSSPPFVRRDGLMRGGVVGAMMLFYLIWLVPRRLLGEKVRSQGVLFCGFWKVARVMLNWTW